MIHSSGHPLRLVVWQVDSVCTCCSAVEMREKQGVRTVVFLVLCDRAQFDDELEQNLLHTDS